MSWSDRTGPLARGVAAIRLAAALLVAAATLPACAGDEGAPEPWSGTLVEGLATMETLAEERRFDDALEVADRMGRVGRWAGLRGRLAALSGGRSEALLRPLEGSLRGLGLPVLSTPRQGEIEFARAVVLLRSAAAALEAAGAEPDGTGDAAGRMERAVDALGRARASGGDVSRDAVYDLGTLDLQAAEALRDTLPEVSGGPPPPLSSAKDDASGKDDRDPLEMARRAYLSARADLVERLRMGADPDARANVELVIRRLRELDEIERQREQQEQPDPQSQGDPSEDAQDQESSEQDPEEPEDPSEDEQQEGEQDAESEQPAEDQPEEGEEEPQTEEEPAEETGEEPTDDAAEEDPEEEDPEKEDLGEEAEELMTEEERSRILERNRQYQENGEQLRRILRMRRKVPARRDW